MRRQHTITLVLVLVASAATAALYVTRLVSEEQCGQLNGAIDFEGRVCIIGAIAHPLREAAMQRFAFWGVVAVGVAGVIYGASRTSRLLLASL
jgi:hypothetical protein